MTKRFVPASLDCLGCRYCELRAGSDDRNTLVCTNAFVTAGTRPDDVSACFTADTETEGGDHD